MVVAVILRQGVYHKMELHQQQDRIIQSPEGKKRPNVFIALKACTVFYFKTFEISSQILFLGGGGEFLYIKI